MIRSLRNLLRPGPESPEAREWTLYEEQIREALKDLEPYARSHGGTIDLISAKPQGDVRVRFGGNCRGCPMSEMTLRQGVEAHLRSLFPDLGQVVRSD